MAVPFDPVDFDFELSNCFSFSCVSFMNFLTFSLSASVGLIVGLVVALSNFPQSVICDFVWLSRSWSWFFSAGVLLVSASIFLILVSRASSFFFRVRCFFGGFFESFFDYKKRVVRGSILIKEGLAVKNLLGPVEYYLLLLGHPCYRSWRAIASRHLEPLADHCEW